MIKDFTDLIEKVKLVGKSTICVAAADDEEVLKAVKMATDIGIVDSILVGDKEKIETIVRIYYPNICSHLNCFKYYFVICSSHTYS